MKSSSKNMAEAVYKKIGESYIGTQFEYWKIGTFLGTLSAEQREQMRNAARQSDTSQQDALRSIIYHATHNDQGIRPEYLICRVLHLMNDPLGPDLKSFTDGLSFDPAITSIPMELIELLLNYNSYKDPELKSVLLSKLEGWKNSISSAASRTTSPISQRSPSPTSETSKFQDALSATPKIISKAINTESSQPTIPALSWGMKAASAQVQRTSSADERQIETKGQDIELEERFLDPQARYGSRVMTMICKKHAFLNSRRIHSHKPNLGNPNPKEIADKIKADMKKSTDSSFFPLRLEDGSWIGIITRQGEGKLTLIGNDPLRQIGEEKRSAVNDIMKKVVPYLPKASNVEAISDPEQLETYDINSTGAFVIANMFDYEKKPKKTNISRGDLRKEQSQYVGELPNEDSEYAIDRISFSKEEDLVLKEIADSLWAQMITERGFSIGDRETTFAKLTQTQVINLSKVIRNCDFTEYDPLADSRQAQVLNRIIMYATHTEQGIQPMYLERLIAQVSLTEPQQNLFWRSLGAVLGNKPSTIESRFRAFMNKIHGNNDLHQIPADLLKLMDDPTNYENQNFARDASAILLESQFQRSSSSTMHPARSHTFTPTIAEERVFYLTDFPDTKLLNAQNFTDAFGGVLKENGLDMQSIATEIAKGALPNDLLRGVIDDHMIKEMNSFLSKNTDCPQSKALRESPRSYQANELRRRSDSRFKENEM